MNGWMHAEGLRSTRPWLARPCVCVCVSLHHHHLDPSIHSSTLHIDREYTPHPPRAASRHAYIASSVLSNSLDIVSPAAAHLFASRLFSGHLHPRFPGRAAQSQHRVASSSSRRAQTRRRHARRRPHCRFLFLRYLRPHWSRKRLSIRASSLRSRFLRSTKAVQSIATTSTHATSPSLRSGRESHSWCRPWCSLYRTGTDFLPGSPAIPPC